VSAAMWLAGLKKYAMDGVQGYWHRQNRHQRDLAMNRFSLIFGLR